LHATILAGFGLQKTGWNGIWFYFIKIMEVGYSFLPQILVNLVMLSPRSIFQKMQMNPALPG